TRFSRDWSSDVCSSDLHRRGRRLARGGGKRGLQRWGLMSDEHFSVDGTLLQAWASHKSFRPKDGTPKDPPGGGHRNAQPDFKGRSEERRVGKASLGRRA